MNKKIISLVLALSFFIILAGCKTPEQIDNVVKSNSNSTQEIVIKQELAKDERAISVTGVGNYGIMPDIAVIEIAMVCKEHSTDEDHTECETRLNELITALRGAGLTPAEIEIKEALITPAQNTEAGDITNYQLYNSIVITTGKILSASEIIIVAMRSDADKLVKVSFELSDAKAAYREALALAVVDANEKAALIAKNINSDLNGPGRVIENGDNASELYSITGFEAASGQDIGDIENIYEIVKPEAIQIYAKIEVEYLLKYPAAIQP